MREGEIQPRKQSASSHQHLLEIVGMDACTLVSCIPGELAYFEMEGSMEVSSRKVIRFL